MTSLKRDPKSSPTQGPGADPTRRDRRMLAISTALFVLILVVELIGLLIK